MDIIEKNSIFQDPRKAVESQAREKVVLALRKAFSQGEKEMRTRLAEWLKRELKRKKSERLPRGVAEDYLKQEARSTMKKLTNLFAKNDGLFGRDEILSLTRGLGRLHFLAQNAESCGFSLARREYSKKEQPSGVRFKNFMLNLASESNFDIAEDLEVVDLNLLPKGLKKQLPRFMTSRDINIASQELFERCRQTSLMKETGRQIDYIDPNTAEVARVDEKRFSHIDLSEGLSIPLSDTPIEKGKLADRLIREQIGLRV